jgi:hypothetical protein
VKRCVVALALSGALAGAAAGQERAVFDSAAAERYSRLLSAVGDSVRAVSAAGAELRRDLRGVGDETVISRAMRLRTACRGAATALATARPTLAAAAVPRERIELRDSLVHLSRALADRIERECLRGLDPKGAGMRADTLRAWGPARTARLDESIAYLTAAMKRFADVTGLTLAR